MGKSVCVVGAGLSGLAAVRALRLAGHQVCCYEAGSALGGGWRHENDSGLSAAYRSLHTNVSRRNMRYPSLPIDGPQGERLHHRELLAHLERYAEVNELLGHIHFRVPVRRAWQDAEPGWLVQLEGQQPRRFDALVVAAGAFTSPAIPPLPGGGEFAGEQLHVRDYSTPEPHAGRRVLVLGAGQSALDIAAEISSIAERTLLACRDGHHLLPPRILGLPFDYLDTPIMLGLPWSVSRLALQALLALPGVAPERGELPRPSFPMLEHRWPALATPNIQRALRRRAFTVKPGVQSFDGERVLFADGTSETLDTIVFATGYRIDFPFLDPPLGRGEGQQFPLYRRILSPHAPDLAFIGVFDCGAGRLQVTEQQATWLAAQLSGRLDLPGEADRWATIDGCGEPRTRRRFGSSGAHTILCDRHAYLRVLRRDLARGA